MACQGYHWDWKTRKNGKAFTSRGILTDWKSQENHAKYQISGEFETNVTFYFSNVELIGVLFVKMNQVFS